MAPTTPTRRRWRAAALVALMPLCSLGVLGAQAQTVMQVPAESAAGGVIRVLDKITGEISDLEMGRGQTRVIGRLTITLGDCRYPSNNPNSDAWGWLEIRDDTLRHPVFSGWMVASSPALNAMDHERYDVWMLRCSNS